MTTAVPEPGGTGSSADQAGAFPSFYGLCHVRLVSPCTNDSAGAAYQAVPCGSDEPSAMTGIWYAQPFQPIGATTC